MFMNASRGLYASYLMWHVLRDADAQLGSANRKKMALFSTHDTSLAAVLALLRFKEAHIPLYPAHIAIEYWKNPAGTLFVRFVFNGRSVEIDLFEQSVIPFDEFSTFVRPLLTGCPDVDSWEMHLYGSRWRSARALFPHKD
jgi:hypothetical protein